MRLLQTAIGSAPVLLPPGRTVVEWHQALVHEISHHLSPAHASLLSRPEPVAGGLTWTAEGTTCVRYDQLPADGRRALDAAAGGILSDIRRLAESGEAAAVRDAWPALREIPDLGHLFAVDGRPVLAAWGHASGASRHFGLLDDAIPWRAKPSLPWRPYATTLAALALLALTAGTLLPLTASWFLAPGVACPVMPGQLEMLRDQMALESRGQQLQTLLATLTEEVGRRQLLCPIAAASSSQPIPPAALPQDGWTQHDLGMLQGCWNLHTTLSVWANQTDAVKLSSWRLCFDSHGVGQQTATLENGRSCQGPLTAAFNPPDILQISQPAACTGSVRIGRGEMLCRRLSDSEAHCDGRNLEGTRAGTGYSGQFQR